MAKRNKDQFLKHRDRQGRAEDRPPPDLERPTRARYRAVEVIGARPTWPFQKAPTILEYVSELNPHGTAYVQGLLRANAGQTERCKRYEGTTHYTPGVLLCPTKGCCWEESALLWHNRSGVKWVRCPRHARTPARLQPTHEGGE